MSVSLDDVDRVETRWLALKEVTETTHEQQARGSLSESDAALYAVVVQHIQNCIPVRRKCHALFSKGHSGQEDTLQGNAGLLSLAVMLAN